MVSSFSVFLGLNPRAWERDDGVISAAWLQTSRVWRCIDPPHWPCFVFLTPGLAARVDSRLRGNDNPHSPPPESEPAAGAGSPSSCAHPRRTPFVCSFLRASAVLAPRQIWRGEVTQSIAASAPTQERGNETAMYTRIDTMYNECVIQLHTRSSPWLSLVLTVHRYS